MLPTNTKIPIGKCSGVMKILISKMLNVTGKMIIFASVTNRPSTKAIPHISSIPLANGIKYVEINPPEMP